MRSEYRIGVPREILNGEYRVSALPETVEKYVEMGFAVLVEQSAGEGALRSDAEYESAGAEIVEDPAELFRRSDLVLKVKQPCFNADLGRHEVEMLREGAVLIAFLHPVAPYNHDTVRLLRDRQITALTMDGVPRTSRAQAMDALTSMSTIAGYKAVLIGANLFPKPIPMTTTVIGMVPPARVLVVGAGVVGLQAIATAKRLGGSIKAVDIREDAREAAASLGVKVAGYEVPPELATGEGGYARALPPDWLEKERAALAPLVEDADIVILSALVPGEAAPKLVAGETVERMRPGAVVIDVAIDQGGNCEATEPGKETRVGRATICGSYNIPGTMPVHASWLYANNLLEYVRNLFKNGVGEPDLDDDIVRHSLVTHQGRIVHRPTLQVIGPE